MESNQEAYQLNPEEMMTSKEEEMSGRREKLLEVAKEKGFKEISDEEALDRAVSSIESGHLILPKTLMGIGGAEHHTVMAPNWVYNIGEDGEILMPIEVLLQHAEKIEQKLIEKGSFSRDDFGKS